MREIKFRGTTKHNGSLVYGNLFYWKKYGKTMPVIGMGIENGSCQGSVVLEESISEYTGLEDKNGKEIYGSDILDCWEGRRHVVKFDLGSFYFETLDDSDEEYPVDNFEAIELEVIGNIYENPELLEVK
jgi:uncharacterized phage protein (TIGR01671 family)